MQSKSKYDLLEKLHVNNVMTIENMRHSRTVQNKAYNYNKLTFTPNNAVNKVTKIQAGKPRKHNLIPGRNEKLFSLNCRKWLWGPPRLSRYWGIVHQE
jgi:hypothetical protein